MSQGVRFAQDIARRLSPIHPTVIVSCFIKLRIQIILIWQVIR